MNVIVPDVRSRSDFRHVGRRSNLALRSPLISGARPPGLLHFRGHADALVVPKSNAMFEPTRRQRGVALLAIAGQNKAGRRGPNPKYPAWNRYIPMRVVPTGRGERVVYHAVRFTSASPAIASALPRDQRISLDPAMADETINPGRGVVLGDDPISPLIRRLSLDMPKLMEGSSPLSSGGPQN